VEVRMDSSGRILVAKWKKRSSDQRWEDSDKVEGLAQVKAKSKSLLAYDL
jgi:hypothetical protein